MQGADRLRERWIRRADRLSERWIQGADRLCERWIQGPRAGRLRERDSR